MSLKHVKRYYDQIQEQYLEMLNDAKDFDHAVKNGLIDQEQYDQAQTLLSRVKENYERLSYIIYLFYQPNRDKKAAKFDSRNKELLSHFTDAKSSKDAILEENADMLKKFKQMVKEIKK
jgi:iron uptake system EfeUOB component EfeO/EfeM